MEESMLGSSGEDLGLVIDFATKLRHGRNNFRERAKKFLRSTLFIITLGDGKTKEQLLAAFDLVSGAAMAFVKSDRFRFADTQEDVELEFVEGSDFDDDPWSNEVLAELTRRGLEEPTEEDALRYGATCPKGKDKRSVVFLHEENLLYDSRGGPYVLIFFFSRWKRHLNYLGFGSKWDRKYCRFAGRRPRK